MRPHPGGGTQSIDATIIAATAISLHEASAAREQATRAQTVTRFLIDMFRFADPKGAPGGVRLTAKEMLDAFFDTPADESEQDNIARL